ncbi:hypothetical protein BGZ70_003220 [Mortierella alpina]|uniref:Protein with SprT-like domain at the N terminus n=1 Tax=Mortierella alpina TaxID=64518 RepID=A0A9P6JAW5_MORAP|nr:hypothetical protein BGZ70_003220 [Mortierella alpina]
MEPSDEDLARALQEQEYQARGVAPPLPDDPEDLGADLLDSDAPFKDLHGLFLAFNDQYFESKLSACEVRWSPRMTRCAGLCLYQSRAQYCSIRLSEPLLKFRPESDYIDTLLHEMIHAYLFVTKAIQDHDGHGPDFQYHMNRINAAAQTTISIYHTFHDEVAHYQTHVWKCNGPCQHRPPYFGLVKRSMNRPPQPADRWFAEHQSSCGGTYTKISEPEPTPKKSRTAKNVRAKDTVPRARTMLDDFLFGSKSAGPSTLSSTSNGFNAEPHNDSKSSNHIITDGKAETIRTSTDNKDADHTGHEEAFSHMLLATKNESSSEKDRPAAKEAAAAAALARFDRYLKRQDHTSSLTVDNTVAMMKRRGSDSTSASGTGVSLESWKRVKTEDGILADTRVQDTSWKDVKDSPAHAPMGSAFKVESEGKFQTQASILTGALVQCPVCSKPVEEATINDHVDLCIWRTSGEN